MSPPLLVIPLATLAFNVVTWVYRNRPQRQQTPAANTNAKPKPIARPGCIPYDGTLHSLVDAYLNDPLSPLHGNRYSSRQTTNTLCRRLIEDRGSAVIAEIKYRTLLEWHAEWVQSGVSMAHSLMGMLSTALGFGMTILECDDCAKALTIRKGMRFKMAKPKRHNLTFAQVELIIPEARRRGLYSMASAQIWGWACTLRQKDQIGEYEPLDEPTPSDLIVGDKKHVRGLRWESLDDEFVLHHATSKRGGLVEPPVYEEPLMLEELNRIAPGCIERVEAIDPVSGQRKVTYIKRRHLLPASGPIIVNEITGVPWTAVNFRKTWREIAREVGIPDHVKNCHTRHGAITEATNAGVSLEIVAKAASHRQTSTTAGYSLDQSEKHGISMRARVEDRERRQQRAAA